MLFDRGRRGLALQRLDISGDRDGFNVFDVLNQRKLYPLLFDCAGQSLLQFGRNRLRGDLGITAVLHTWGQKLDFHPHLHCIVTGGALKPGWQTVAFAQTAQVG